MVKPQFVDECSLLFYKVYQEPPKNNEIYLKFATCFVYERCFAVKADLEALKIAWVLRSLKHNPVAWKRKVDAFRDTHGPINVITTGDSIPGPSMQANVKGRPEPCFMSSVIEKLRAKILNIQSNNNAKVLKNELKEKKAEFLNKRDVLICREAMIQTKITSLQTRYWTLKGANAIAEQLAAVEIQITAMSSAVKLIKGDDKIADMKIDVESIERDVNLLESKLLCSLHYMSVFENMMKQLANDCTLLLSPTFYALEEGRTKAAHHMSFGSGRGYTENVVGVDEENVFYLGIASPGGEEKSWSDREAAKNVGHDTVPPESTVLGAKSEEGVEAVLGGNTDAKSVFLVEFVKRLKSNRRTVTTTALGEGPSKKTRSAMQKDAGIYLQIENCTAPSFDSNDAHLEPSSCNKKL
ncbi:hypothetical protein L7F22_051044 [Adiantum nelumboides]|nr:hypothetical protein [Adiantum nelumboides]